jgi:hypothetical protein
MTGIACPGFVGFDRRGHVDDPLDRAQHDFPKVPGTSCPSRVPPAFVASTEYSGHRSRDTVPEGTGTCVRAIEVCR